MGMGVFKYRTPATAGNYAVPRRGEGRKLCRYLLCSEQALPVLVGQVVGQSHGTQLSSKLLNLQLFLYFSSLSHLWENFLTSLPCLIPPLSPLLSVVLATFSSSLRSREELGH